MLSGQSETSFWDSIKKYQLSLLHIYDNIFVTFLYISFKLTNITITLKYVS